MNWKKFGIIGIIVLAMTVVGTAYIVGDDLTPAQFKELDISKHNFAVTPTGNEVIGSGMGALLRVNTTIETFEKQANGDYKMIEEIVYSQYGLARYADCRDNGESAAVCKTKIKDYSVEKIANRIVSERGLLEYQQTQEAILLTYASELEAGDITITAQEINDKIVASTLQE